MTPTVGWLCRLSDFDVPKDLQEPFVDTVCERGGKYCRKVIHCVIKAVFTLICSSLWRASTLKTVSVSKLLFTHIKRNPCSSCYFAFFRIGMWAILGVFALFQSFLWAQEKHILTIPLRKAPEQSTIVWLPQLSLILNLPLLHHAASFCLAVLQLCSSHHVCWGWVRCSLRMILHE